MYMYVVVDVGRTLHVHVNVFQVSVKCIYIPEWRVDVIYMSKQLIHICVDMCW